MLDGVTDTFCLRLTLKDPAVVLQADHASEPNSVKSPANVPIQKLKGGLINCRLERVH